MYIYGLYDPVTGDLRYVGATKNINRRLSKHLSDLKYKCHRVNWIKFLLSKGIKPDIRVIEEVPDELWQDRERYWISYYKGIGVDLTNETEGGDGIPHPSPEIRLKMKHTLTQEQIEKMANSLRGRKQSQEQKDKISAALKGRTYEDIYGSDRADEMRLKRSGANSGRGMLGKHPSPDTVEKIRAVRKGKTYEEIYGSERAAEIRAKISHPKSKKARV